MMHGGNNDYEVFFTHTHTHTHHIMFGTADPSGAPEFTPGFSGIRVTRSLVLCVCFVNRVL